MKRKPNSIKAKIKELTAEQRLTAGIAAVLITAAAVTTIGVIHNTPQIKSVSDSAPVFSTMRVLAEAPGSESTTDSAPHSAETPLTNTDVVLLSKTVWGEARGCAPEEQRLVVWTVLQRVDAGGVFAQYDTIEAAITAPGQFVGYDDNNPVEPDIYDLCLEVLSEWQRGAEPPTHEIYAPTAPYYFFDGDGQHNWFREEW